MSTEQPSPSTPGETPSASSSDSSNGNVLVPRVTTALGLELANPKASGRMQPGDLVELAASVQTADQFLRSRAHSKLAVIAEQVRLLHEQATAVLQDAARDQELNHIACNFRKVPGNTYYVYRRKSKEDGTQGDKYFSMLSPKDWGSNCPEFVGAYRLEFDMSWTSEEKLTSRSAEDALIEKILQQRGHQNALLFN